MSRLLSLGLLVAASLVSGAAYGAAHASLDYQCDAQASDCPTEQELADAVAIRLGYMPFDSSGDQARDLSGGPTQGGAQRVLVRVSRMGGVWSAKVQLWDTAGQLLGERTLTDPGGGRQGFAESIALAISLALDPLGSEPPKPIRRPERAAPEPPAAGAPTGESAGQASAATKSKVGVVAALGLVGAVGTAPNPNLGLELSVDLRWPHASLGLVGRGDLPASGSYGGGTVTTSLVVGEVVPCLRWDRFAGCLLAVGGVQSASGSAYMNSSAGSAPFGAAGARVSADFPLGRSFSLEAGLEAWSPFTRTSVDLGIGNAVWTTSPIEGALTLSILYAVL